MGRLLELLLVELCRAALTCAAIVVFDNLPGLSHVAGFARNVPVSVQMRWLSLQLWYASRPLAFSRHYITSNQFLLDVAHGFGTLGPACAALAPSLRAACARTRRYFQKRDGKQLLDVVQDVVSKLDST